MTIKGLNWMYLGAAFALSGCGSKSSDTETDDGFEVDENTDEEASDEEGSGSDSDSAPGGGDGVFDVDTLFVSWNGAYRDGSSVAATYVDEDGVDQVWQNSFSFIWIDSADYSQTSEDYICRLEYDSTGAAVADYSEFDLADEAYMTFQMDLGAVTPTMSGNCDGAAAAFGAPDVTALVLDSVWGFGFGPMTDDFEDELSTMDGLDYAGLGDRPGVSYLRWQSGDGAGGTVEEFTAWGYFQVIPFADADNALNLPITDPSQYLAGVRDSAEPADGLYVQETVYILQYGG